ncbi:MAG: hypothetical protein NZZ41_00870 [Candidatus Dojkabacteria bacterium]|nr:hypothetical protein [Candidatus Dojkabacteria bacterium]
MKKCTFNICCLKVGEKYHHDYVNILYNSCNRFCNENFDFYLFTEDENNPNINKNIKIKKIKTEENIYGWWYKLLLLSDDIFYENSINLYLDLDIVIINSISKFFMEGNKIFMPLDWIEKEKNIYNSSVMVWNSNMLFLKDIWKNFLKNKNEIIENFRGDQEYISEIYKENIESIPEEWCKSFKEVFIEKKDKLSEKTSIIVFHGYPKPHDVILNNIEEENFQPWIRNFWR